MKVICIDSGSPGENAEFAPVKGQIYTVAETIHAELYCRGSNVWYVLEEIPVMWQHESLFTVRMHRDYNDIIEQLKLKNKV